MNQIHTIDCTTAAAREWDVIIIGGGMGGGSAAYALAKCGHRVLLIEKGRTDFPDASPKDAIVISEDPSRRLREGRWPTQLTGIIDGTKVDMWPPLGCGLGGSSLLYAAALERLNSEDFESRTLSNGETVSWPYTYQELEPYYQQAEALYAVSGSQDPLDKKSTYRLSPPPHMSECDQYTFQAMENAGLHPYRIHVGVNYIKDCDECGGHYCHAQCKADSRNRCILPALKTGNLTILDQTEVQLIEANSRTAHSVCVTQNGLQATISAKIFIIAAGAYFTPAILQNSSNTFWPKGLANNNDLVGRYLMFHASDFIAFWPKGKYSRVGPQKTIALRDFYTSDKEKLGELQSTGLTAGYGNILYFLTLKFNQSFLGNLTFLRHFLRIPAYIGAKIFNEATVFATIVEDHPYPDNRVILDNKSHSNMRFEYNIQPELKKRVKLFRKLLKTSLKGHRIMMMNEDISLNFGHPCGTCRAGNDPASSVLDSNCKVHELDNLYVADSSFMPTSGGTNPSLTIAANALRVAHIVSQQLNCSQSNSN